VGRSRRAGVRTIPEPRRAGPYKRSDVDIELGETTLQHDLPHRSAPAEVVSDVLSPLGRSAVSSISISSQFTRSSVLRPLLAGTARRGAAHQHQHRA
jgi:hypothetical protein